MQSLNYNHFYYFWVIAKEMSITMAAKRLRLSQSTLSAQLRHFELALGQELFQREKKRLVLSESGRIALDYADKIFTSTQEMVRTFEGRPGQKNKTTLKVGAVGPLSKNIQYEFLLPLLLRDDVKLIVTTGPLNELLKALNQHFLDVILSSYPVKHDGLASYHNEFLGQSDALLVTRPGSNFKKLKIPSGLQGVPMFLPTNESRMRADFNTWVMRAQIYPLIKAEVEDMALLRLFALSGNAITLVPKIVVKNELNEKRLLTVARIPNLTERFYAITAQRKYAHPWTHSLIEQFASQLQQDKAK